MFSRQLPNHLHVDDGYLNFTSSDTKSKTMISLWYVNFFIVFFFHLQFSFQDLLKNGLEYDLSPDEIELLRVYRSQRHKRQSNLNFYQASGIKQSSECGINKQSVRGKRQADDDDIPSGEYEWPWIAALLNYADQSQFCGGSLINHQYILTAAHCFWDENGDQKGPKDLIIRLGEWDLTIPDETKYQDLYVAEIKIHEQYDRGTQQNDIALIKLERSVDYNTFIRPICLPSTDPKDNETTFVAGWGRTKADGDSSLVLLNVQIPVVIHQRCVEMSAVNSNIFEGSNICAGGEGGKDSCQGDSGGPLTYQEDGRRWVVTGIVSWGHGCGDIYPGVYTNVRYYLQWIGKRIFDAVP